MGNRVEPQVSLGEAVEIIRAEKKLTKSAVASRAGISDRWLRSVEDGKSNPTLSNLRRLAYGLRVNLTDLTAKVELVEKR